jgi:DNA-binding NtrC family response regulator
VKVDVRILATSNRDLPAEVRRGAFREDLYYRLNVVSLRLPSLRERPGDVAALAEHFARKYAEVNGLPYRPLSPAAVLRLTSHGWPGNVRELENTLHRAVLLADGATIDLTAIELGPQGLSSEPPNVAGQGVASLVGRRMEEVERDLIIHTLGHTLGNRTHAATILGISIRALRNKLRDYAAQGVPVPPPAMPQSADSWPAARSSGFAA